MYKLSDERAIISTMDFFPPVVDDAYDFGAIAAANALSDVYAMGGEPLMAINLVAFPDGLDHGILSEILRGGAEKALEAGTVIAGGHTVADKEPKYGLAVTGTVHPDCILTKSGAKIGDALILTKALGTGVITTALKNGRADANHVAAAVASMKRLNRAASMAARDFGVQAMTDITGYGLLGHAYEMAAAGNVQFDIAFKSLQWLDGAEQYARADGFPGGMWRNRQYFEDKLIFDGQFDDWELGLLFDPQTSGGLLIAVEADKSGELLAVLQENGDLNSAIIGEVQAGDGSMCITK